ncbi:MAG: molybdopterin-synthase adenylyltransferase MoeB [Candidatus Eiseniibacteriota bacterium]|jgi:adenylyltransferase/sulfurtransferase
MHDSPSTALSREEILRYSRHLIMPQVGMAGQRRLRAASVLCVGAGGLGAPAALYLAAAGVGRLGLVDRDTVELSNLQRQILHGTSDVGRSKVASAREALRDLNPLVDVRCHETTLAAANAAAIIGDYDIVVDGSDNFATRYLVNDACVQLGKPDVYGAIYRFEGQVAVFDRPRGGPCYRCLFPEPPPPSAVPSCAEGGVLGVLPGIIGSLQALETIKLIIGQGEALRGRLLLFDALAPAFRTVRFRRQPDCPVCGEHPTLTGPVDTAVSCAAEASPAEPEWEISATETARRMAAGEIELVDVREPHEWEISRIAGARLLPLSRLLDRLGDLPQTRDLVLVCHVGIRSMQALRYLRDQAGMTRVRSLRGGINAWSEEVDASVPRY